jgi:acyl-coenzyme A synthetase/AMP-(fatty) acid ligase
MACLPSADFFNLYGPTETNVCTFHALPRPLPQEVMEIPIGRACSGDEAFALTPDGQLAGPGETGELLVRGPTVALGYWRDPQKTAASLVQNPLHADFVDPVYRTGDLVRVLPDGAFGFVGRRDHMVKTRGYRVELGEVEAVLAQHARVREAIVVPIPDPEIGTRLIAVVVAEEGAAPTPGDLRGHCAGLLPTYAIPERFELRAELPRTGTGKTDRVRLAAEFHPHSRKEDHVAEAAAPAVH